MSICLFRRSRLTPLQIGAGAVFVSMLMVACLPETGKKRQNVERGSSDTLEKEVKDTAAVHPVRLVDTTIQVYGAFPNSEGVSSAINPGYAGIMTESEKAALGFVVGFTKGSEYCSAVSFHDFNSFLISIQYREEGQGYADHRAYLRFLRKWFATDKRALKRIKEVVTGEEESCSGSIDRIRLKRQGDLLIVMLEAFGSYKMYPLGLTETPVIDTANTDTFSTPQVLRLAGSRSFKSYHWDWKEKFTFLMEKDKLTLVKNEVTKPGTPRYVP